MENIFIQIGFLKEEIDSLLVEYVSIDKYKVEKGYELLKKYGCRNEFIKYIVLYRKDLFLMDFDRVRYTMDAIISNGDIIEETLLELI